MNEEAKEFLEGRIKFHDQQAAQKRAELKRSPALEAKEKLNDEALKHDKAEIAIKQELKETPPQNQ